MTQNNNAFQIARIRVWQLTLPLSHPYFLSGGRLKFEQLDSVIISIDCKGGLRGWGEGCPWGRSYLPAHGPGIVAALQTLAPVVLGEDARAPAHLCRLMDRALPGHGYAKSPLDIAFWDILGQSAGMPLWQLFGGATAEKVALNSSISTGTPEEMLRDIADARALGYRMHSAKIGGDDVAADVARINAIAAALPPTESVTFDINRAWLPSTAIACLNQADFCGWIEQPCETLSQCAHVASRVRQPLMLDECLHTMEDHLQAWKTAAGEGVKVKPNRVGGLTRALQIRDFGVSVGWRMHIEDVGGTALADTAAIHLASSTPAENRLPSWLGHAHLSDAPVPKLGVCNNDGYAKPPSVAGLGASFDDAELGKPCAIYE